METRIRANKHGEILCTNQREVRSTPHTIQKRKKSHGIFDDLDNVDFVSSNVNSSRQEALLYVFDDNEAVIKMIIKGRSPTMRHVSRTHRVGLDWLIDRIDLDPKIQIKYTDTKNQLADILTKGNFTRDEWNHLSCLFNISNISSINKCKAMSKRTQEDAGQERVTAKPKPMTNLVSRCSVRDPTVLASIASENPEDTKSESQKVHLSSVNVQQTGTGRPVMRSPEDSMQDIDKRSMIWGIFMSSTVEASVFMGKNYSDNLHSTLKQMFEISEQLILEESDEIFGVSQINWEDSPWTQLSLVNDEEVISLSQAKVYVF